MKPVVALVLLLRFVWQLIVSGLTTAWLIVRPARPRPGLVRMRYRNLDDVGVSILGCLISLTPGTTTIDIDTERGELLLHLLDADDPAGTVAGIRSEFERPLQRLYPAGEANDG
ncbi:Na+/H+ antiporter subunit E [Luteimonas abyssi]|uniref:Na+/H+ antiporter subunit E n=1 Tax=Luteimonas abyssi TaxID=1247514 RepID=UPI000737D6F6|nr:Na+/H+ antiporter subunit E [Luteimonas abyssi]